MMLAFTDSTAVAKQRYVDKIAGMEEEMKRLEEENEKKYEKVAKLLQVVVEEQTELIQKAANRAIK